MHSGRREPDAGGPVGRAADSRILPKFTVDDLDPESLRQYRNRFSARNPKHHLARSTDMRLLEKLGGWGRDRESNEEGLTVAGLLMFGKEDAIMILPWGVSFISITGSGCRAIQVRWADRLD